MYRSILALVFLASLPACSGATSRAALPLGDDTIAVRVRTALLNDPVVHANEITVTAQTGVVVLRGQVHGQQEANAAVAVARRVEGVKDVLSELQTDK